MVTVFLPRISAHCDVLLPSPLAQFFDCPSQLSKREIVNRSDDQLYLKMPDADALIAKELVVVSGESLLED
jgi:hypothetical protein